MSLRMSTLALCCALSACNKAGTTAVVATLGRSAEVRPEARDVPKEPLKEVKRTLLAQREIADMPGFESRIYLVEYPPGMEGKLHVHGEQGVGYVIEGRFESAFGNGPLTVTQAGEGFIDTPHEAHRFRNPDPVHPLRFVVAGTFRKDEPLFLPVQH